MVFKNRRGGQSATSATSAIAEIALCFSFLFLNIAEVALRTKVFKICCTLIAQRFQIFFSVNSAILYIDLNFQRWSRGHKQARSQDLEKGGLF